MNIANLHLNERGRDGPSTGHASRLPEDGQGLHGRAALSLLLPLEPDLWEGLKATARSEGVTTLAIAATTFALLLERLAGGGGALAVRLADHGGPGKNPTFIAMKLDVAAAPDLAAASREALRVLDGARTRGVEARPNACTYGFAVEGSEEARDHPCVEWPLDAGWELGLLASPGRGGSPGVFVLTYDSACFSDVRARSLLDAYARLLRLFIANPRLAGAAYPLAAAHERAREWARHPLAAPCALNERTRNLAELFADVASLWPQAVAAAWRGGSATFADIAAAAAAIEKVLRRSGAESGDILAFRLTAEAPAMGHVLYLATQVAAFRLGCAVLPLGQQRAVAQARLQIETMRARFLISATRALDVVPDWVADARHSAIEGFPDAVVVSRSAAARQLVRDAAFVLTTSGTTGIPKAIRLSHPMLLGLLRGVIASGNFPPSPALMGANIAFDMAIADLWLAWAFGRHVVLLETERRTPAALAIARELGARVISLSPTVAGAALREDPDCFAGFDTLFMVGEVVPRALANLLRERAPALALVNGYGPAETSILATLCRVAARDEGPIPVGWALEGYRVLVADPSNLSPMPPHWPGELLIAGPSPALGYADEAMTAARFISVPGEAAGPFFRTGDIGWVDGQGQMRFIGRHDRQHKIAGVRIELDGIEHVVSQVAGVEEAAALLVGPERALQVAAVVKPAAAVGDRAELHDAILTHCRAWLPRAAVPARMLFVEKMPTGGTGKKALSIMRALLEQAPPAASARGELPVPGSLEERLASIWRAQFESNARPIAAIRLDDDVFALGATSLDALTVAVTIERSFNIRFPDEQMFLRPTVAGLAEVVRERLAQPLAPAAGGVVRRRIEFRLARVARGAQPSRGVVLCLPDFTGGALYCGTVAANAFDEFDVWASTCDLGGKAMDEGDLALEVARSVADAIIRDEISRPVALFGFSISAWIAWLAERELVSDGFATIPIVNFEGHPLHLYYEEERGEAYAGWRKQVDALRARAAGGPRAEMLLLHNAHRCWYGAQYHAIADAWTSLGVDLFPVQLRSLRHQDAVSAEAIAKMRSRVSEFASGGRDRSALAGDIAIAEPGGAAYELLEASAPPGAADVEAVINRLPETAVDHLLRVPLLFLAAASGDADLTLGFARRLAAEDPAQRFPVYAEVAVLAAIGRKDAALARAEAWIGWHPTDRAMRARVEAPFAAVSWERGPGIARWPFQGLDFAVGFIAQAN